MLRNSFLFFIAIICLTNCKSSSQKNEPASISTERQFRNVNWGMTKSEVIKNENAKRITESVNPDTSYLLYDKINLFGKDFTLAYEFDSAKLKAALYYTSLNSLDNIKNIYSNFKQSIMDKYGLPKAEVENWSGTFKELPEEKKDWYMALSMNELSVGCSWSDTVTNPKRGIMLKIEKNNNELVLSCRNTEIDYYVMKKNELQKKQSQNF